MAEELNSKLSGSDIRKFEQTLASFDATLARQEEIAKQVLKIEKDIAELRLGALTPYFDAYSKGLDEIIARKTSKLGDAFLIMEQKAAESYKKSADTAIEESKRVESESYKADTSNSNTGNKTVQQTVSDEQINTLPTYEAAKAEHIADKFNKYKSIADQIAAIDKEQTDAIFTKKQLEKAFADQRIARLERYSEKERELEKSQLKAIMAKEQADAQSAEGKVARLMAIREVELTNILAVSEAERKAQELRNSMDAELAASATPAGAENRARLVNAAEEEKALQALKLQMDKERAELEYQAKLKNNGKLSAQDALNIDKQIQAKFAGEEKRQKFIDDFVKKQVEDENKRRIKQQQEHRKIIDSAITAPLVRDNSLLDRIEVLRDESIVKKEDGDMNVGATIVKGLDTALSAISTLAQQLDKKIDEIASSKGAVDTRLQGSSNKTASGSYWDQIVKDMTSVGAVNPFFKQENFANKIKELVDVGIAFDLEQRAFLATISDKIATTFNVADSTLLRLIRIQQQDSSAGRLGMEAALNAFLNEMYENTEYLKTVASGVRASLAEMQSLMEGAEATEVEYQVQKWLGSLYSVGMSNEAVNSISQTLGQIAAGQIDGLTNGGAGNLLVMAASDAGLSIADILTSGINSKETNELMQAVVNYLAEIAESSKDNNVVQQQLANVFGVKASDLRAATNLTSKNSVGAIYDNSMAYGDMLGYLYGMAGSIGARTSLGEMMTNVWNNVQYTMAGGMASNPATYMLYKTATLLDNTVGGIPIPDISIMGNAVALNTTVADIMRVGAMAGGILSSFGSLISGLGNSFSGQAMLDQLGINSGTKLEITPRGNGSLLKSVGGGQQTVSESGYGRTIGNTSGSDIKNATMQEAKDSKKQLMVEAQEEEEANQINVLNATVLKIYELLDDVAHGSGCFRVKVDSYGLTKAGSSSVQGGVGALDSLGSESPLGSSVNSYSSGGSNLSGGGVNSGGLSGGSIDFGGWTTTM
jgi:hypothetical protein